MSSNKDQQFTERLSTAASARRAMLEKFQARRTVDDPAVRERRAAQEALRAARETRMAEQEAARRLSRPLRGSCRKENTPAEQVEAGATVHLPLDQLEPGDLALGLAAAPRRRERGPGRSPAPPHTPP